MGNFVRNALTDQVMKEKLGTGYFRRKICKWIDKGRDDTQLMLGLQTLSNQSLNMRIFIEIFLRSKYKKFHEILVESHLAAMENDLENLYYICKLKID